MRNRGIGLMLAVLAGVNAHAADLQLGISEGTSGGTDHARALLKYEGFVHALEAATKRNINLVFVREFAQLEEGMKSSRLDLVMARPSDYPARGLRDYGYRYVASVKPEGQCLIAVGKNSPVKTLADLKGKKIVMPEKTSYMTKLCRAELRNNGIDLNNEQVTYVREQEAVAFYIHNGFNAAGGLASYSGAARKWLKDGGTVLHRSVPQPYSPLIASKNVTPAEVASIQKAVLALSDSAEGKEVLKTIGMSEGFDTSTEAKLRGLLKFLGE